MHIKQRYQNYNFSEISVMAQLQEQKFDHSFKWKDMIYNCIRGYKYHIRAIFIQYNSETKQEGGKNLNF